MYMYTHTFILYYNTYEIEFCAIAEGCGYYVYTE